MSIVRARPPRNLCRGGLEGAREGGRMTDSGAYYASSINNVEKTSGMRERERENRIGRGRNNNNNNEKLEGICVHTYVFIYTHTERITVRRRVRTWNATVLLLYV